MNKAFHCDPMRFRLWEDILVCFKGHNVGLSCLQCKWQALQFLSSCIEM